MNRFAFLILVLLALPSVVQAQTTTKVLSWSHVPDTLTVVNGYTFTLKIDAGTVSQISPTCATAGANVTCSTPIVLTSGTHTLVVTATNGNGSASGSFNYVPGASPTQPTNIVITVTITVP